ncbi:MAG: hypothetical protein Q9164_007123, partial [Protoblastenia rupestris]
MHCYFVLAGDATIPILYHVERVREGRSFLTRTVQARQRGKCIFTTTISFMREDSGGAKAVEHGWDMPDGVREALEQRPETDEETKDTREAEGNGVESPGPFMARRLGIYDSMLASSRFAKNAVIDLIFPDDSPYPQARRPQSWLQCRGSLSPSGGIQAHLSALAYMSDSWFIGTVSRIHRLSRFSQHASSPASYLRRAPKMEIEDHDSNGGSTRGQDLDGKESVNTPAKQPNAG